MGSGVLEEDAPTAPSPLHALTRTIASQYVDVLAGLVTAVFGGRARDVRPQLVGAASSLERLAVASEDAAMAAVLGELPGLVPDSETRGRARDRSFRELRAWTGRFADLLNPEDGARMRSVVEVDPERSPFVQELLRVEGIGEKRMERLYCAGLVTVSAVVGAAPAEIAAVTGLPLRLAERVVQTARRYEQERPQRVAANLLHSATQTRQALEAVPANDPRRDEILTAARAAVEQLLAVLAAMETTSPPRSTP